MNLKAVSEKLPTEVTGADMYAVCSGAWLGAVRRIIKTCQMGMSISVIIINYQQS